MINDRRAAAAALMATAIVLGAAASPSGPQAGKQGPAGGAQGTALGIFLGQPTGLTGRIGLGGASSFEAKAAWDLAGSKDKAASFTFQANYLMEFPGVLVIEGEDIPPYLGGGAQLDVGAETRIGLRAPVGLVYRLRGAPLEFCLEIGIGMGLFPSTRLMMSGGVGARLILGARR
jgi:hypothetical protein